MIRDACDDELIAKNPLMIQKTVADKLSDKIQVIVAPPSAGGFFAGRKLGGECGGLHGRQRGRADVALAIGQQNDRLAPCRSFVEGGQRPHKSVAGVRCAISGQSTRLLPIENEQE